MKVRTRAFGIGALLLAAALPGCRPPVAHGPASVEPEPLPRAHAHNDYEHARPLLDALERGFGSVEADVWLVDGELLVAHARGQVVPARTLEALYLRPLRERVRSTRGTVFRGSSLSLQLLVDIKSDAEPTYDVLHRQLSRYADLLTSYTPDGVDERAVTVVVSGNRPRARMAAQPIRYASVDGRLADLGSGAPRTLVSLISDRWGAVFRWQGVGPMPAAERAELRRIVGTAHAAGQRVRFWSTPEAPGAREAVWSELAAAGIDYVNSDALDALRAFLLRR